MTQPVYLFRVLRGNENEPEHKETLDESTKRIHEFIWALKGASKTEMTSRYEKRSELNDQHKLCILFHFAYTLW